MPLRDWIFLVRMPKIDVFLERLKKTKSDNRFSHEASGKLIGKPFLNLNCRPRFVRTTNK